jgi:hypothetical protein
LGRTNPIEYVEKPTPESREVIIAEKQWDSILAFSVAYLDVYF